MGNINFNYGIGRLKANLDGLLVYYSPKYGRNIARRYIKPRVTETIRIFGSKQKHLSDIWKQASTAYKQDMKIYAGLLARATMKQRASFCIFVTMCWNWQKANPAENILSLSRERIINEALPMRTIAEAVQAGYLDSLDINDFGNNLI
jgi:hypothetical protein